MRTLFSAVVQFGKDSGGHTAIEYAFLLSLILVACISAISLFGSMVNSSLSAGASHLPKG